MSDEDVIVRKPSIFRRAIRKVLGNLLLNVLALGAVVYLLDSVAFGPVVQNTGDALKVLLAAGFIIGVLNVFLKPVLKVLTLPAIILSVGLFLLVINAVIFYLTVQLLPPDYLLVTPNGYFWGALLFSIVNSLEHLLL